MSFEAFYAQCPPQGKAQPFTCEKQASVDCSHLQFKEEARRLNKNYLDGSIDYLAGEWRVCRV